MTYSSVSVGFPVYNEEENIEDVLLEAHKLLSSSDIEYEILVCDDGSTDRSGLIIKNLSSRIEHLRVINHPHNLGIRATFEHLYSESRKDFVFVNAVDRQWDTAALFDMLPLTEKADIIIASRKKKPYGLMRTFISWGFNLVPLILFGVRTYDAGAVKLVRREIIRRFSLVSKTPFSEAERLIRSAKAGYRIVNYPLDTAPRCKGRSHSLNLRVILEAFRDILRVWRSV